MLTLFTYNELKMLKLGLNSEESTLLPRELTEQLSILMQSHSTRLRMLIESDVKYAFKDISELSTDLEHFQIISQNYSELSGTQFIETLYQNNLARQYQSKKELDTELSIRRNALLLLNTTEINNLKSEIILKLINSNRKFESFEKFIIEVTFRSNVVTLMNDDSIHNDTNKFRYPTSEANFLQLNPNYWDMPDQSRGFFQLKEGILPSDAINSIFDKTQLVVLECHSMMLSIMLKALLNTLGEFNFNFLYSNTPLFITDKFNLCDAYQESLNEIITPARKKKEDLIPGDWLYLNNFTDYSLATLYDETKDGNGLHSLVMEQNTYRGFGRIKPMTESEMKQFFLHTFNNDFRAHPLKLSTSSIQEETMGLDCLEEELIENQEVTIYGHIDCPILEWKKVNCIYKGNGHFDCASLDMKNVTEEMIVLSLLEKFNSILPKMKSEDDLNHLNMYLYMTNNIKTVCFANKKFDFLFQESPSKIVRLAPFFQNTNAITEAQGTILKPQHKEKKNLTGRR